MNQVLPNTFNATASAPPPSPISDPMNTRQTILPRRPPLLAFTPSPLVQIPALRPAATLDFTVPSWAPAREDRPAVLWRESLAVVTGRFARTEAWAFLVLAVLTLLTVVLSQSGLWQLLTSGALERAVHAFLFLPGGHHG